MLGHNFIKWSNLLCNNVFQVNVGCVPKKVQFSLHSFFFIFYNGLTFNSRDDNNMLTCINISQMLNPVHLPFFTGYVECCSSCWVSPRSQRLWLWRWKCSFQLGVSCSTWWLFHFFGEYNESFWNFIAQLLHLSCLLLVHLSSLLCLCSRHISVKVIVKDNPLKGVAACNIRSGVEKHWRRAVM